MCPEHHIPWFNWSFSVFYRKTRIFYTLVSCPKRCQTFNTSSHVCLASFQEVNNSFYSFLSTLFVEANSPSNPAQHSNPWRGWRWISSTRPTTSWIRSLASMQGKLPWLPEIPPMSPELLSGWTYVKCFLSQGGWAVQTRWWISHGQFFDFQVGTFLYRKLGRLGLGLHLQTFKYTSRYLTQVQNPQSRTPSRILFDPRNLEWT